MKFALFFLIIVSFFVFPGLAMEIESPAFKNGADIPVKYTCDSLDVSPPLSFKAVPSEAKSLVLFCDDPDAPGGEWVHWVIFNIPPDTTSLEEGIPAETTLPGGARQGRNDFENIGFSGPCPPAGKPHRYFFRLCALDINITALTSSLAKKDVMEVIKGHVIAQAELMGMYKR